MDPRKQPDTENSHNLLGLFAELPQQAYLPLGLSIVRSSSDEPRIGAVSNECVFGKCSELTVATMLLSKDILQNIAYKHVYEGTVFV
jgi:hypothetical protein